MLNQAKSLESYQELFDSNPKNYLFRSKNWRFSSKIFQYKKQEELIGEFLKVVEIENSKKKKATQRTQSPWTKEKRNRKENFGSEVEEIRKGGEEKKSKQP